MDLFMLNAMKDYHSAAKNRYKKGATDNIHSAFANLVASLALL